MEGLYNVYAWRHKPEGGSTSAVRVAEGVDFTKASITVDAYLNRGLEWDAYLVEQSDDPGWTVEEDSKSFKEFVKEVGDFWGDGMPVMCIEELGELIQAISKCERKEQAISKCERKVDPEKYKENLIEEMGDVLISVWALAHHYGITQADIGRRVGVKMSKVY